MCQRHYAINYFAKHCKTQKHLKQQDGRVMNDFLNKEREKRILNLKDSRWLDLIHRLCDKNFDDFKLCQKAGRNYNHDFSVYYYRDKNIIQTTKLEYKFGSKSILQYPQFISIYTTNKNKKILATDYVKFWYQNYMKDVDEIYKNCILDFESMDYEQYKKHVNSTTKNYYHVCYKKLDPIAQSHISILAKKSIQEFIAQVEEKDIHFDVVNEIIRVQKEKVFVFELNNSIHVDETFKNLQIPSTTISKNANNFILHCGEYDLFFLLRWKNKNGVCGPAFQVSIRKHKN